MVLEDAFESGAHDIGIAEDGVGIDFFHPSVPQEVKDTLSAYAAAIGDGTIVPPVDDDTASTFELVPPSEVGASASPAASPEASPAS
jgi:hypothetical protein